MNFQVTTAAATSYGERVQLKVELEHPAYMTGLTLAPYSSYPVYLEQITCDGVSANNALYNGSALLDRKLTLTFPRTLVRSLTLTLRQENYTLKVHNLDPPNQLRRDALASLQTILPYSVRSVAPSLPQTYQGAQYQLGFEEIQGEDLNFTFLESSPVARTG